MIKKIHYCWLGIVSGFTNHHIHTDEMSYVSEDGYNMLTGKKIIKSRFFWLYRTANRFYFKK